MAVELLAPEGLSLESVAGVISGVLSVRERRSRGCERSYYDTFDGLVRTAGVNVAHEDGTLDLLDSGVRVQAALRRPTRPLLAADLPAGVLRDALEPVIGVRALLPVARVHAREQTLDVLDDERKTVARIIITAPAAMTPERATVVLRVRATLSGVRGYDAELEHVRGVLVDELGFGPADSSLVDDAVRACGGTPGGISAKVAVELERGQSSASAVAAVLRRLLEIIEANLEGTLADTDSEFLHDLRVAVRRSRAVQRELHGVFDRDELARFRADFSWLQQVTGPTRDLTVQTLEFEDYRALVPEALQDALEPVLDVVSARRRRALSAMRRDLRSERTAAIFRDWEACLSRLPGEVPGPTARRPIEEVAGGRIRRVYRRMMAMGKAIDGESPAETLHDIRKQGKELRYLLELFGGLYPPEVVRPLTKTLKSMQDVLGRHQDRAVQVAGLIGLTDDVAARPGGVRALVATGALAQRLLDDELEARVEFAERFAAFASKAQRQLIKAEIR